MFQVRKLPSSVRYLVVFVSGMASLLSGASLVHYVFKPDLVSESMITSYNYNFNVIYLILFNRQCDMIDLNVSSSLLEHLHTLTSY
jgi:hypothetical protein